MFQAHNVVRESLEHRAQILLADNHPDSRRPEANSSNQGINNRKEILLEVQNLRDIAKAKCTRLADDIIAIVKLHLQSPFFEWDANLVRGKHLRIGICFPAWPLKREVSCKQMGFAMQQQCYSTMMATTETFSAACKLFRRCDGLSPGQRSWQNSKFSDATQEPAAEVALFFSQTFRMSC